MPSLEASDARTSGVPGRELTERQRQVLALLDRGLSNKQIAAELGLREQSVKAHVSRLLDRYGAESRLALVLKLTHPGNDRGRVSSDECGSCVERRMASTASFEPRT